MTDWKLLPEDGEPCRVVAEISNAHNGDQHRAHDLVAAALRAGVDAVKFQAYTPDELVALRGDGPAPEPWGAEGWTMRKLYEQAQTPFSWFPDLVEQCHDLGLPWFASVFGPASLAVMEMLGCPVYKVASLEHRQRGLREKIRATGKPLVRSLPLKRAPKGEDVFLYCPPGYPQEQVNLKTMQRGYHGLSYHGTNPVVPAVAIAYGARVVEVHVHLEDAPSELEAANCLDMAALGRLCDVAQRVTL